MSQPAGWAGNKARLSTFFDAERRRLGDSFGTELLKWLEKDPEKHYRISFFVESESYLHGNKAPATAFIIDKGARSLVRGKEDERSSRRRN